MKQQSRKCQFLDIIQRLMFLWQINTGVEYDEFCKVLLCTFLIFQEIKDYMIFPILYKQVHFKIIFNFI